MKSKSNFLIPVIGVIFILVGGIATYLYLQKGGSGDNSSPLSSAKVIPANAVMAAYLTTESQPWAKLQQFGTDQTQQTVSQELKNLDQSLLKDRNISYENDIKPWVGGVMIAVLPTNPIKPAQFQPSPPIAPAQNFLLVVGIKDQLSALNFANKLKSAKDVKIEESDYKGQKIITNTDKGKTTYTTVLNNTKLLLALQKPTIEKAIDTFKGEPSFASQEGVSSILNQKLDIKNTIIQVYIPNVKQCITTIPQFNQLVPEALIQKKHLKSLVTGIGVNEQGLQLKVIGNLDPQPNQTPPQNTDGKLIEQFPGDTLAVISGNGQEFWQEFSTKPGINQFRNALITNGLDLDKDIIKWTNGSFALGAVAANQGILANFGFKGALALVFSTSDRQTAESTLSKLDNIGKKQSFTIAQRNIGGKDITEWQIPQQGVLLAHGWLDQNTVFLTFGGPVAEALAERKNPSLDKSETFKATTDSLAKPKGGYFFYLDVEKTVNQLPLQKQSLPPANMAILSSIRGFGATVTNPDKSTTEVEMLLALKPKSSK